jgi:two-component system, NarL family, nitrate/nitrite response regulator NarL
MLLAGMNADIRVLVLEQGSGLTHDLTLACRRAGIFVLGPVRDVAEAQAAALEMSVDVMVVELSGPSVTVVREAAEVLGGVRILGATDELDPDVGAAVIAAGGTGLLPRTASIAAFVDALRRAAAGELVLPDTHLAALVELVRVQRFDRSEGSKIATLTHREREVLSLLADGRTTGEVAIALSISVMTVQSHVKNVLAKLGVHSKVEAIRSAWRAGAIALPAGA